MESAKILAKSISDNLAECMENILNAEDAKQFVSEMESIASECGMTPEQLGSFASSCIRSNDTGIAQTFIKAYLTAIEDAVEQHCIAAGLSEQDVKVSTYYDGFDSSMVNVSLSACMPREITSGEGLRAAIEEALEMEQSFQTPAKKDAHELDL